MPYVPPRVIGPTTYYEGEDIVTMWRPRAYDGTLIVDSEVANWDLYLYEHKAPSTPLTELYSELAQSTTGVMFSSPQTPAGGDGSWDEDPEGYTFLDVLLYSDLVAASVALEGGKLYRIEYILHTNTYNDIKGIHLVETASVRHQ